MKILNTEQEDYHVHSSNFSDSWNSVDEVVKYAGSIGMKKIVFCDHSQACLNYHKMSKRVFRSAIYRWKNVHNDVDVSFGVEADLLNSDGDICSHIDGVEGDFIILSYHDDVYSGKDVVEGFLKAIDRFHEKIDLIGHVCCGISTEGALRIIQQANKYNIPCELNAKYFEKYPDVWDVLFKNADSIYVNSDAHVLNDLRDLRKNAFKRLKELGYV